MFHGKGGYDWATIQEMPIWVRKFVFEEMKQFYEEQNQDPTSDKTTNVINKDGTINRPAFENISKDYQSNKRAPKYK